MPCLTAMIMTLNEEKRIGACLERLSWADEMLVVDSGSKDRTVEIASGFGARVVFHQFTDFSSQINWGFSQAESDWIFLVDADELATPELCESIRKTLNNDPRFDVYQVVRDAWFLEHPMRASSWSNDRIPRLFKKGSVTYTGLVHQGVNKKADEMGVLDGKLIHHTYESIEHYFEKIQKYTTFGAKDAFDRGKRTSIPVIFFSAFWRFFHNYFIRGEILDGRMGLLSSGLAATYSFIKYAKLWGFADAEKRQGRKK